jgi:hypothetical protein
MAIPAETPVQIRSDRRSRKIARLSRKAAPVQAIGSNVEVVRCEVNPAMPGAMPGAMPAAIAANAAALAPPPSKRAKLAARNTNPSDRCRQSQHPDVDTENLRGGRDQRHQRRLIDVTKIQMPAASEEIEFVALRVVLTGGRGMNERRLLLR